MMSEFEKQVRHALIDRDMTMTDLANELGITISYVRNLIDQFQKSMDTPKT